MTDDRPQTAEEAFAAFILDDTPLLESEKQEYRYTYTGAMHNRLFGLSASIPEGSPYSTKITNEKDVTQIPLQPYNGPLRGRLDRQAVELRRRLTNPKAVMLVMRGKTYSAESVWGVFWLFIKTKFFKRWAKKNFPALDT